MKQGKRIFTSAFVACLAAALLACSVGATWNASWPSYSVPPAKTDAVALLGPGDVFTLMRAKWYSNKFGIPEDSTYAYFGRLADSVFKQTLVHSYTNLAYLDEALRKTFPEETQKLDDRIFIKGHFPEQGETVGGEAPPKYLILIHELTLGADLDRKTFFDYSLTQNEAPEKKAVENITIIMTFTLWDNLRQRPLYSSVVEVSEPAGKQPTLDQVSGMLRKAAATIPYEISKGAH